MLTFIKSTSLQKTIEDSIEYINIIFNSARENESKIYKEETYRVIILYVVAIIEAILLYIIKERGEKITSSVYKDPNKIYEKIKHSEFPDGTLVLAVKTEVIKDEKTIGVQDLVNFMKKNKLMKPKTAEEILTINDIRNTFHLTKSRNNASVETDRVEEALALLMKIIKVAPIAIKFKR